MQKQIVLKEELANHIYIEFLCGKYSGACEFKEEE
jgi:hypothetical protein